MRNIDILKRQHDNILDDINNIKTIIQKNNIEEDSADIAKFISLLSGKLKVHLMSEDEHLYPELLNSSNIKIKILAKEYMKNMGNISSVFMSYKNQFNTRTKINNNIKEFLRKTNEVFEVLEDRLDKENNELYPMLK